MLDGKQGPFRISYQKWNNVLYVHLGSISDIDYTPKPMNHSLGKKIYHSI